MIDPRRVALDIMLVAAVDAVSAPDGAPAPVATPPWLARAEDVCPAGGADTKLV